MNCNTRWPLACVQLRRPLSAAMLWLVSAAAGAVEHVAIFVDGMSRTATASASNVPVLENLIGPEPRRSTNYLVADSALPGLIRPAVPVQKQVLWNGNLFDNQGTRTAVDNLEALICQQRGKSVDLITHSLGTVIAYAALAELAGLAGTRRAASCGSTEIATFVTLGSPLGLDDTIPEKLGRLSSIEIPSLKQLVSAHQLRIRGRWLNVYAIGDRIGGKIDLPSVVNVSFSLDQAQLNPDAAHSFPYKDADAVRLIADVILGIHARLNSSGAVAPDAKPTDPTAGDVSHPVGIGSARTAGMALKCDREHSLNSTAYGNPTSVEFVNNSSQFIKIYWIDYAGRRVFYKSLSSGQSYIQQTFVTHPWIFTNANNQCMGIYLPPAQATTVTIP